MKYVLLTLVVLSSFVSNSSDTLVTNTITKIQFENPDYTISTIAIINGTVKNVKLTYSSVTNEFPVYVTTTTNVTKKVSK